MIMSQNEDLDTDSILTASEPGTGERDLASHVGRFLLRALWEIVTTVVPAVFIALFINVYVAQATVIDGPSMQPNLYYDQWVMMEKVTYRFLHGPRRGDVMVFDVPGEEISLIKRVVALPGETVEVRGGQVFIDEQPLEEPWTTQLGGPDYPPTLVPPLHVFVLGDNRPVSRDSRYFGPVPLDQVHGRAWIVCWPPGQVKVIP
jgi:signal peptidase I